MGSSEACRHTKADIATQEIANRSLRAAGRALGASKPIGTMDIISTKGVAKLLDVSEATVKRWADAGMLRCFRTRGGHRKFRLHDVNAFLADEVPQRPPEAASPVTALSPEQAEARTIALAGDIDGLVSLVTDRHLRGVALAATFDHVFAPALRDIGEAWVNGGVSAAQEHVAANAVAEMLARVRPLVDRTTNDGNGGDREDRGRALCACLGEERHDLGVRMVALVLLEQGYRPAVLGASVPAGDLARMVARDRPAIIALSASSSTDAESLRVDLAQLATAASTVRARIVVGGSGFAALPTLPSIVARHDTLEELAASNGASTVSPRPSHGAPAAGPVPVSAA